MDKNHHKVHAVLAVALLLTGPSIKALAETAIPNPGTASAGTIYKSIDSSGNVVFTDKPGNNPNAVVVTPQAINISDPGSARTSADKVDTHKSVGDPAAAVSTDGATSGDSTNVGVPNAEPEEVEVQLAKINQVEIVSPLPEATLIDVPEPLYVGFQTAPATLAEAGLTAEVYVDGRLAVSGTKSLLPVPVPERGTHTILVKLIDKDGRTQVASKTQQVHIKKRVVARGN